MRSPQPPPIEQPTVESDRMWPLDMSIAALAGLVLYLVVTQLRFDDPRWLFNAWTYAIAVPVVALILAVFAHRLVSQRIQKSIQLGFLFSVFVHLLLLLLAVNVIIFSRYFPDAFAGAKPERSPIRHTVPEHLFQTPQKTATTPDWSEPVDAVTTSRIVPEEQRQLPPVERSAPRLEMPKPREEQQPEVKKFLMERDQPAESQPLPADSPAKLARRVAERSEPTVSLSQSPTAPDVPTQKDLEAVTPEREVSRQERSRRSTASSAPAAPSASPFQQQPSPQPNQQAIAGARSRATSMPTVGESGMRRERSNRSQSRRLQPAGAAPAPQTVAIAREVESADRMLAPTPVEVTRQGRAVGAQLTMGESANPSVAESSVTSGSGSESARNNLSARSGTPNVTAGQSQRAPGRARRPTGGMGFAPAGVPDAGQAMAGLGATSSPTSNASPNDEAGDRFSGSDMMARQSRPTGGTVTPDMSSDAAAGLTLDMLVDDGLPGLSNLPNRSSGLMPSQAQPMIAALDLSRNSRPRKEVGGPASPVGTEIAAVESFSRRVMRTRGGAAPTPAGMVGPATEEAIEKGLAYLASIQNDDGSWSLQNHGSDVVLRSDTAATGLCLLSFQGAGYTHLQHQYAETVSRGLQFLVDNQKVDGDLYRSENRISNQNVAFYSHGIASLALCESYGMTQDPNLQDPAQKCLDYIAKTQHTERGGWRYSAQVSADTSVTGWMMMSMKSGELAGLDVSAKTYQGIDRWLGYAQQSPDRTDRFRYDPFAPNTPTQRHGRSPTPTMTAVGILMRMYQGLSRNDQAMESAANYLLRYPPQMGTRQSPQRDAYYWYYATQVMFHMGGEFWEKWNEKLTPVLLDSQVTSGPRAGSWDPISPIPDRWSQHAGRLYVTTMNLLNLEVYYRHLPIYENTVD
ncbi:MAG: prenyltransferase/squalene oxidase repeat-containing protein [Rubripirellula sp.]